MTLYLCKNGHVWYPWVFSSGKKHDTCSNMADTFIMNVYWISIQKASEMWQILVKPCTSSFDLILIWRQKHMSSCVSCAKNARRNAFWLRTGLKQENISTQKHLTQIDLYKCLADHSDSLSFKDPLFSNKKTSWPTGPGWFLQKSLLYNIPNLKPPPEKRATENKGPWLFHVDKGWHPTQLYGDYNWIYRVYREYNHHLGYITGCLGDLLIGDEILPRLFKGFVDRGWNPTQSYGDYFINHKP